MSLFRWLYGPPGYLRHEDSFARNSQSKLAGLRLTIENRTRPDQLFIVVAHFAEAFINVQNAMESWSVDHEIVTTRVDTKWLSGLETPVENRPVYLTLAEMLEPDSTAAHQQTTSPQLAVIAMDLYPLPEKDFQLEQFCRSLPHPVELVYFLSFDDPVVRQAISDNTIQILDMFGMGENELITSNMVSRRLKQFLTKQAKQYVTDIRTDSADEWFIANGR